MAVAEELTRRGVSVELFEKNESPGREASCAAAGILSPLSEAEGPGPFLDLLLQGYQLIPEAVTRLTAAAQMDLRFKASGMLELALTEKDEEELSRRLAWQQEIKLRVEKVSSAQVRAWESAVDGSVRWALFTPQTAQVDNTRMVEAYVKAVLQQGGVIRTKSPVSRFEVKGGEVLGVETPRGLVRADWVVDCAGAWAGFDQSLGFKIPAIPVKGQMLRFRTQGPQFKRVVKSPRAYFVQRSDDQLVVGTTVEYVGYDKNLTPEGTDAIQKGATQISSRVKGWNPEERWAGLRPATPDRLPILGASPVKRLLLATGHFRNGILLAPLTGRLMADWITKGAAGLDLTPFQISRFFNGGER